MFEKIVFSLLLFLVIFTPLAFGAVQPWSVLVFQLTVLAMLISWFIRLYSENCISIRRSFLYLPVIAFIGFVFLQLIPLPAGVIKSIAPQTYALKTFAAGFLGTPLPAFSLSLNSFTTFKELILLVCYAVVFFMVINEMTSLKRINAILVAIIVLGFFVAVFAIIQKFSWNGKIYWFQDTPGDSFGPFVNYDHYGGYVNMIVMVGLAFTLSGIETTKRVLTGFMTAVMVISVLLSKSRGAVMSLVGGMVFFAAAIFFMRKNFSSKSFPVIMLSVILIAAFVTGFVRWMDVGTGLDRLASVISFESNFFDPRFSIWHDSCQMFRDFSWWGIGFGNYNHIFPVYQQSFPHLFWRHTHNDYLELLIDAGPFALLCAAFFIALYLNSILRKLSSSRNAHLCWLLTGCSAAVVTMLIHSTVDFNLRITSNAFLFILLIGLSVSLAGISRKGDLQDIHFLNFNPKIGTVSAVGGLLLTLLFLIIPAVKLYAAHRHFTQATGSVTSTPNTQDLKNLQSAVRLVPSNASYRRKLGLFFQSRAATPDISEKEKQLLLSRAKEELEKALLLSPAESDYWASYGWLLGNLDQPNKAQASLERAITLAPNKDSIKNLHGKFLRLHPVS